MAPSRLAGVALDPRPRLTPALERLLEDVAAHSPDLSALDTSSIVVVALQAHGTVAASVRSLDGAARSVVVGGVRRRVELGLRPPFFVRGDATRRLATLVHELLHLDPRTPGALLEAHRHAQRSHEDHEAEARVIAKRWLARGALALLAPLGHDGEVLLRAWLHRPVEDTVARRFTDRDTHEPPLRIVTGPAARSVWW